MLAIYKEVEDYYYGDETCEGLKDWKELEDVIFLLSDDNYGHLRALPKEEERKHQGGFGMYYHFDYHGAPVSYEWTNCNRLTKTWEQMTQAYDAGVKEMWIVNVGDLKSVEYPLCYFMELAYDFETWGSTAPNKTELFLEKWIDKQFGSRLNMEQKDLMKAVIDGYTKWNAIRSPEAMREGIFQPVHFRESERVWHEINGIYEKAERLNSELDETAKIAYQSMIYYPAIASMNLILMYLEVGLNKLLAKRGCLYANHYEKLALSRIQNDNRIVEEYHNLNQGKWNHCMSSAHTGFRNWDDNDWTYPTTEHVSPIPGGKVVVSFRGSDQYHLGAHWQDRGPLMNDEFTRSDKNEVLLDIDSRGDTSFAYALEYDCPWLLCAEKSGRVEIHEGGRKTVLFSINRAVLSDLDEASVLVKISFDNGQRTFSKLLFKAAPMKAASEQDCKYLFVEHQGICSMSAAHFNEKKDIDGQGFQVIEHLGREGAAIKAFPSMKSYRKVQNVPYVRYSMLAEEAGTYILQLSLLTRNPSVKGGGMRFAISVNDGKPVEMSAVSANYYTEWFHKEWADGVLNHARNVETEVSLEKGRNDIFVYAGDPGVIIEKIILFEKDRILPISYLGPEESFYY